MVKRRIRVFQCLITFSVSFFHRVAVMPPDEFHSRVNNSIFTNAVAFHAVYFASYSACLAGRNSSDVPEEWKDIVSNLTFTYNSQKKYHEEFQGFDQLNTTGMNRPSQQQEHYLFNNLPLAFISL